MKTEILEIGRKQDQMEVKQDEVKVVRFIHDLTWTSCSKIG